MYFCYPGSKVSYLVVAQAVLVLCVFKYANFLGAVVFGSAQKSPVYWRGAFLPLGISFFTFEFIHYAVDRYRGKAEPALLSEFLAFVLFFPTMVAGPIKRIQDFAPKINNPSTDWQMDFSRGITRILSGLVRKFAIADLLTSLTNHLNATDIARASSRLTLIFWLFAYGIKIYFDFSAYSDIAIGSARLFGIRVPENFDSPYLRRNIAEFWQHWHISLYRWLIDYIFIPLGGSRVPSALIYRNLIIVMLASGIWHGAGLHFVLWGAWHAILLSVHRAWSQWQIRGRYSDSDDSPSWPVSLASWLLTFVSVNVGWAFFAMDVPTCVVFFRRLFFVDV